MDRFDQAGYERLLRYMNRPLAELLGRHNRDSMAGAVGRLVWAQPRIVGLGIRALLAPYSRAGSHPDGGTLDVAIRLARAARYGPNRSGSAPSS